jgi:ATP-dependent exoDNAse (exonuclease V) alpha subunit
VTSEETTAARALRAAARTIGQMTEASVEAKFAQLRQARNARSEREIIRQQAETDSLELDEAAYEAALKHEESGDLTAAARWYRAAAVNDFPGASLKLAAVLTAMAAAHRARGETHAEEALVADALEWCTKAFAAGEDGASDLIEELDARLDPHNPPQAQPRSAAPQDAQCALGGLRNVVALDKDKMIQHLRSCGPCRAEQARTASTPAPR